MTIPIARQTITLPITLRTTSNQIKSNQIIKTIHCKFNSSIKSNQIKSKRNDMRTQKKQYQQEEKNQLNNLQE
jgi:hypothetical protein